MARIRTIKPEFWTSDQVAQCSLGARLLFIAAWNFCDDGGVHPDNAKRLKMQVFPGDEITLKQIGQWLGELHHVGLIRRYTVNGEGFFNVTGWRKHQKIDKPSFKYPKPPSEDASEPELPHLAGAEIRGGVEEPSESARQPFDDRSPPEGKGKERSIERVSASSTESSPRASENLHQQDETTRLPDDPMEVAKKIIQHFDESRNAAFGSERARPYPRATDLSTARRWIAAGATPEICRFVFDAKNRRFAQRGGTPMEALAGFEEDISNALAGSKQAMAAPNGNGHHVSRGTGTRKWSVAEMMEFRRKHNLANVTGDRLTAALIQHGVLDRWNFGA